MCRRQAVPKSLIFLRLSIRLEPEGLFHVALDFPGAGQSDGGPAVVARLVCS